MGVQASSTGETLREEGPQNGDACFQVRTRRLLGSIQKGFTIVSMDESIIIHGTVVRRIWAPEGMRPKCVVTANHQRTVLFGALSLDGRQLFRQYSAFNEDLSLDFLKKIDRKFRRLYVFLDRERQHYRSAKVRASIRRRKRHAEDCWVLRLLGLRGLQLFKRSPLHKPFGRERRQEFAIGQQPGPTLKKTGKFTSRTDRHSRL